MTLLVGRRPDAAYGLYGARNNPLVPRLAMQAPNVRECNIPKLVFAGHGDMWICRQMGGVGAVSRSNTGRMLQLDSLLRSFILSPRPSSPSSSYVSKILRPQHFGPAMASGMLHDRGTATGGLLITAFAFIEWPHFRKCMKNRWVGATSTRRCLDRRIALSKPGCGVPIHIGATTAN